MNKPAPEAQNKQATPASTLMGLWLGTCARYTVLCLILMLISAVTATEQNPPYIDTLRFFLILPFAFCVTVAARIRNADKLSTGAKYVLHPITVLGGFYLFCYLPFQVSTKPSGQQVLLILLLAAVVYGIFMGIFCLIRSGSRRKKVEDTPYVSQFGKK